MLQVENCHRPGLSVPILRLKFQEFWDHVGVIAVLSVFSCSFAFVGAFERESNAKSSNLPAQDFRKQNPVKWSTAFRTSSHIINYQYWFL